MSVEQPTIREVLQKHVLEHASDRPEYGLTRTPKRGACAGTYLTS